MVTGNQSHPRLLLSPLGSIDEEDDAVLDEYILDDSSQAAEMAAHASFSNPSNVFSSQATFLPNEDDPWASYPLNFTPPSFNAVNGPAHNQPHSSHPGHSQDASVPYPMYGGHPAPWQPINVHVRPHHAAHNGTSSPYDIKMEETTLNSALLQTNGLPLTGHHDSAQHVPSMASPQSETGWVSASSASDQSHRNIQKDAVGRAFATFPTHLRREGIRKKNARVEIPDGRTIDTIEQEIKMCDPSDEAKLKELKQYKRLLRNREAALSSRSRKKEHAQRLEEENKALIASEDASKTREAYWVHECQKLARTIEECATKEEELVRRHTLETAKLREKISFLTEEVQRSGEVPLSAAPHAAPFSTTFTDIDHLGMNGNPQWENYTFVKPSAMTVDMQKATEPTMSARPKEMKSTTKEDEPAITGLLFMILLCGAWVASSSSNSKPVTLPDMPEDIRVASAEILTHVYKDAGIQPQEGQLPNFNDQTSCSPNSVPHSGLVYSQTLDPQSMHHMLTTPSRHQQQEQAFSLTAEQYNHITTDWFSEQNKPPSPTRKRNIADALANLHLSRRSSATEAYSRSLLINEVPTNVVRDFHRMVAERNAGQGHNEPLS